MGFSGAGAGVGAENSIIFRLRLQQKSTAPDGSGFETLVKKKILGGKGKKFEVCISLSVSLIVHAGL